LFYLGKLIVQQSFQPPAYFVIFSDEFKFTYKTVSSHKPNILQSLLMMLLNLLLCVVQISSTCDNFAPTDAQKSSVPAVQASSFGSWFRLAENIETIGFHK
jgi:hypothetical protein